MFYISNCSCFIFSFFLFLLFKILRQGSVVVDSVLIFNDTNNVPDTANVTSTLEEAIATNGSDVAELAINGSSIVAERKHFVLKYCLEHQNDTE